MKTPEQKEAEEAYKQLLAMIALRDAQSEAEVIKQQIATLEEQIQSLKAQLAHFGE